MWDRFPVRLLSALVSVSFLLDNEYMQLGKHIAGGAGFISNYVLWSEAGYFDAAAETKPLLHLWSLGIEEQFYIIWPLLVWITWRKRFNFLFITALMAVISFFLSLYVGALDLDKAFYSPQTRVWELMCGSLLALLAFRTSPQAHGGILHNMQAALGLLLIALGAYTITRDTFLAPSLALLPILGAVMVISAGGQAWINRVILSNRLLVGLGLISFPLYLWHWPLLVFSRIVQDQPPTPQVRLIIVSLSIVLASLTYIFIEKPVRFGPYGRQKAAALTLFMIMVGCCGYVTYRQEGLSFRFPSDIRILTQNVDFQWNLHVRADKCYLDHWHRGKHDASCYETTRPLIALWGDSFAAALYPGLKKLQEHTRLGLIQLTQSECAPVLDLPSSQRRDDCNDMNQIILRDLTLYQPDVLILHAEWMWSTNLNEFQLMSRLSQSLIEIKKRLPNTKIKIVGSVPHWRKSPQRVSFSSWKKQPDKAQPVAIRQQAGQGENTEKLLIEVARDSNVQYVSLFNVLCNDAGCLTRVGETAEDFTAIDGSHLSKSGAEFVVEKLSPNLF